MEIEAAFLSSFHDFEMLSFDVLAGLNSGEEAAEGRGQPNQ
jgi:hypothetical protein